MRARWTGATCLSGRPSAAPARSAVPLARRQIIAGANELFGSGSLKKDDLLGASRHFPSPQADTASHEGEDGRALSVRALRAIESAGSGACELEISNSGDGPISGSAARRGEGKCRRRGRRARARTRGRVKGQCAGGVWSEGRSGVVFESDGRTGS